MVWAAHGLQGLQMVGTAHGLECIWLGLHMAWIGLDMDLIEGHFGLDDISDQKRYRFGGMKVKRHST